MDSPIFYIALCLSLSRALESFFPLTVQLLLPKITEVVGITASLSDVYKESLSPEAEQGGMNLGTTECNGIWACFHTQQQTSPKVPATSIFSPGCITRQAPFHKSCVAYLKHLIQELTSHRVSSATLSRR